MGAPMTGPEPATTSQPTAQEAPAPQQSAPPAGQQPPRGWDDYPYSREQTEAYIKQLREESAGHRTTLNQFRPFQQLHPSDLAGLASIAERIAARDPSLVDTWDQYGQAIRQMFGGNEPEPGYDDTDDEVLTRSQLQELLGAQLPRILDSRFQQWEETQRIQRDAAQVLDRVQQLGYDPNTPLGVALLTEAQRNGGDLDKAHETLEAMLQSRSERLLEGKRQAAASVPPVPGAGGGAPPVDGGREPKTLEDARGAAQARLERILRGNPS